MRRGNLLLRSIGKCRRSKHRTGRVPRRRFYRRLLALTRILMVSAFILDFSLSHSLPMPSQGQRSMNYCVIAGGNRPVLIRCALQHARRHISLRGRPMVAPTLSTALGAININLFFLHWDHNSGGIVTDLHAGVFQFIQIIKWFFLRNGDKDFFIGYSWVVFFLRFRPYLFHRL